VGGVFNLQRAKQAKINIIDIATALIIIVMGFMVTLKSVPGK
jgi:hypothetical protein